MCPDSVPSFLPLVDLVKVVGANNPHYPLSFTPKLPCDLMTSPNSVHPSPQGLDGTSGEKGAPGDVGGPVSGEVEDVLLGEGVGAGEWVNWWARKVA